MLMANHPNRSGSSPARNPAPQEVKDARGEAELTQSQAADLVFVTLNAWQRWEAGDSRMPPAAWWLFRLRTKQAKLSDLPAD